MKKFILLLAIVALFCQSLFAQTGGINFQGVARNASGAVLANQKINLKFSILKTTETGTVEYTETKEATTNAQGIFAVVVGEVNATSFAAVDWKSTPKFLKVEMDAAGGTSFITMGTTRLQNVPYAYYANGVNANNIDGAVPVSKGGTGATDAATARTNLGLVIGTNVQAPLTAGTDYLTPTGNAATATKLAAAKKINGVDFDGSANITVSADASTISGTVSVVKGGTGATNAIDALINLGAAGIESPTFRGTPTAPNPSNGDNSTQIATTAFVKSAIQGANQSLALNYVPYSGATKPVNLGANELTVNGITIGSGKGNDSTNTVLGYKALSNNTYGHQNVAIGTQALKNNTTGYNNLALGSYALSRNTTGNGNIANGSSTLQNNTTGENNVVNGVFSMQNNTTGSNNIASGIATMYNNESGNFNIANGYQALYDNRSGSYNIATGFAALARNSSGWKNIGMGYFSLLNNSISSRNIAIGDSSLVNNTSGENVAFGHKSLMSNSSGTKLTALGNDSDVSTDGLTNATAIGNGAIVSTSNTIQLGNTNVSNVKTSGTLTAGAVTYPKTHGTVGQVLSTTGSGTLTWTTVAGLPYSGNTAGEMLYWNGSEWVKVAAGSNGQTLSFYNGAPVWTGTISYVNTVRSATGRIWMDRNLGASQVATSSTDAASFGDLYQWGRGPDGHQIRTSATTATLSSLNQPGSSNFITPNSSDPADWRSPQNVNLWQGVSGVNNPCPNGFRIPTAEEWEAERLSWTTNSSTGAMVSPLKLPIAGNRVYLDGSLNAIGLWGQYWSSTVNGTRSVVLFISPYGAGATLDADLRAEGSSVRCIKD